MTDESKLKVICPLKYRLYADYIHNNVPYRTEEVELLPHDPSDLDPMLSRIQGVYSSDRPAADGRPAEGAAARRLRQPSAYPFVGGEYYSRSR